MTELFKNRPCIFLENGIRCGKAKKEGVLPKEAINPVRVDVDLIAKYPNLKKGELIANCRTGLIVDRKRLWTKISSCDPRSN